MSTRPEDVTTRTPLSATPRTEGVDAAVAATRRLGSALLHLGDLAEAELDLIATQVNAIAARLEAAAPTREERLIDMWSGEGFTRHDPVTGPENVVAPPLELEGLPDGSVEGVVTLPITYQGPPGYVHGGISALILDHTLGVANGWAGVSGMTGTLTVRYHRPTPLFTELTVRARQLSVDGRKITTTGEILAGEELCVSAHGLFIDTMVARPR